MVRLSLLSRLCSAAAIGLALVVAGGVGGRTGAATAQAAALIRPTAPPGATAGIFVTGSATTDVVPDLARIILSIQTNAPTATQVGSQNAATTDAVKNQLLRAGVAADDIKTLGFQLWPQYDYRSGQSTLTGFMATHQLQVVVHDLRRIGAVIDAGVSGGASSVQGISYDTTDHTAATAQALAKAVKDAEVKAQAMADAAGVRLGAIVSINETQNAPYPYPVMRAAAPSNQSGATQVSPPDIQMTVTVSVGWNIG